MKHLLIYILLIFTSSNILSQNIYEDLKNKYDSLLNINEHEKALIIATSMKSVVLQYEKDSSIKLPISLRYIGNCYSQLKKYDSAQYYWKYSLQILKKQNRIKTLEAGYCYLNIANLEYEKGNYRSSKESYLNLLNIYRCTIGKNHKDYGQALSDIGAICRIEGNLQESKIYLNESKDILQKTVGVKNLDYASCLNNLSNLYSDLNRYDTAINYILESIEIIKQNSGENNENYLTSLNNLAGIYFEKADYEKAKNLYRYILEKINILKGEKAEEYAIALSNLGVVYKTLGDYDSSKICLLKTIELYKSIFGNRHYLVARNLLNVGDLFQEIGDNYNSKTYYIKALETYKNSTGQENSEYANCLVAFGNLNYENGDYKIAEINFQQALKILKKTIGEFHLDYAACINDLGNLYLKIGNLKDAEFYFIQASKLYLNLLGSNHPRYAISQYNLARVQYQKRNFRLSKYLFNKVLEINRKVYGNNHPNYVASINSVAVIYDELNDDNNAELYYKNAIALYKKLKNSVRIDYAQCLQNFGIFYIKIKKYEQAEELLRNSLKILEQCVGEMHSEYINTELALAELLFKTNKRNEAYELMYNNFQRKSKYISEIFEWLNDYQKELFWKQESNYFENITSLTNYQHINTPQLIGLNYNSALITKSILLEENLSKEKYFRDIDELREKLAFRRKLIAKIESTGQENNAMLNKLLNESDSIDKKLTLSLPEYASQKRNLTITWDMIQNNLDSTEAAIEFVRFFNEMDSCYYYNALIVRKDIQEPIMVNICKEVELQNINPKSGLKDYYEIIWKQLVPVLSGIKTIYYTPCGELWNIPFNAILITDSLKNSLKSEYEYSISNQQEKDNHTQYIIDHYTLHQLTSTRYLAMGLKQNSNKPVEKSIAIIGGINYDYLPKNKFEDQKPVEQNYVSKMRGIDFGKFPYLEGTKTEVENISKLLNENNWNVNLIEDNNATEENIMNLEGKNAPAIIHVSTHGYCFSNNDSTKESIDENSYKYSYRNSGNPMVRSGLILAGGNWAWTGSDTLNKIGSEQNGILTALEVSELDLSKTKLIVLSACETAVGKIENTEGSFGLKRGFKLAGIEEMIVSIWPVPDKETKELMVQFYTYLSESLTPIESFQKAQKSMRYKYPNNPNNWAGFVLVR